MPTRLILIRHGQTDWNLGRRYLGFTDVDLNDCGKRQAGPLGKRLDTEKIRKIYSSDSKRALNFARLIFKDFAIEEVSDLREMSFGVFEGMTCDEIIKRYAKIYNDWLIDPFNTTIPRGEEMKDFKERVIGIFKEIVSLNKGKTTAIVTHAGPIRIIICHILKSEDIWAETPDLGSITIIEYRKGEGRIASLNDTSYLRDG